MMAVRKHYDGIVAFSQTGAERRPRDPANATYTNALAEYSL
jgi:hypothetical protein